jgi:hypothetical protein
MTVLTISNQKGGVGKTTTAANLGVLLACHDRRVLVIDADPQFALTRQIGVEERSFRVNLVAVLARRVRRPRPVAEIDALIDQSLQSQPTSKHRAQHNARVRDNPLIVKHDPGRVRKTLHLQVTPWRRTRSRWHGPSCLHQVPSKSQPQTTPTPTTVDRG